MNKPGDKVILSGNEALARGAYEAGVKVASAYPGTPSTEILENLCTYEGVYTEWAPNEKVALEVALGASFAGVRALATMKHVGLNVAADPLFTAAYTGVRGGLVIIVADDPDMHSSQNEQDSRNYALAAKVPMLEPADAAEAREFLHIAYRISEEFDTPVLLRTETRMSHVKGIVTLGEQAVSQVKPGIEKMPGKFVMLPGNARLRRVELGKRMERLKEYAETFPGTTIEWGDTKRGFITSGVTSLYVKEAFPGDSVLKLGMVHPLPEKLIRSFAEKVGELIVVEELDPFIETQVKAMGIRCKGKELIPSSGELNATIVRSSITGEKGKAVFEPVQIPMRPPNLCPGCPHRGIFYAISKLGAFVTGDIGCYTLAALKPLSAMDTCVCMGAGISNAHGMSKALGKEALGKVIAVIGDSTFFHSGITGLINIVFNRGNSTVVILDNRTTGMTGHQPHPSTGRTITGEQTISIDIEALCRAIGVARVTVVDPHNSEACLKVLKQEIELPEPSVIIAKAPCVLIPEMKKRKDKKRYKTVIENCTGCRSCLRIGCPAIEWVPLTQEEAKKLGYKEKQKGYSQINLSLCNGCGQCAPLCKFKAIMADDGADGAADGGPEEGAAMQSGNILLAGVGGQGILLASEILSSALLRAGFDVKQSEVHGMAQRGGSVVSHVRFGKKVFSPLIELGTADITVSFELLEALRYLPYFRKGGTVIVNTQKILPAPVATGLEVYPADIIGQLQSRDLLVHAIDAFGIASSVGESRAVNMVLVGALSKLLPVEEKIFMKIIGARIPEKIRKVNTEAFLKGREIIPSANKRAS